MSAHLLALRERARRWWGRTLVKVGWCCVHEIAPEAWRPVAHSCEVEDIEDCGLRDDNGVLCNQRYRPARLCRYCERIEFLTEGEYFARFGAAFPWPRGAA